MKRSSLYFWPSQALFLGSVQDNAVHRHYAVQLSFTLDEPFKIVHADKCVSFQSVVIASNSPHQMEGKDGRQVILLLDPEEKVTRRIAALYLAREPIKGIDVQFFANDLEKLQNSLDQGAACSEVDGLLNEIFAKLLGEPCLLPPVDPRIEKAVTLIEQLPVKRISLSLIAAEVHLSEGRFIHLFKEQIGIPVRRYLLWRRLLMAVKAVVRGASFTTAAYETGFADSAHLSRTFKAMFGLSPSDVFKNSRFVQAVACR